MTLQKILKYTSPCIISVFFLLVFSEFANARVQYRTVEAKGMGGSLQRAVERALVSGISQVNGAVISSRVKSALSQSSKVNNGRKVTQSAKSFRETIAKRTKGIVKSYEILDEQQDKKSGIFRVVVSVTVPFFKMSSQLKRLKMAVVPMRIRKGLRKTRLVMDFEDIFRRGLENYLTQSRRFAILDRSFIAEQDKEGDFIRGGGMRQEELARLGNRVGTEYLGTGVVERD